jgi:tRNA modification GTPase
MRSSADTIAAIATAAGRGAVGIVRISGKDLSGLLHPVIGALPAPRAATLRKFYATNRSLIDQGLVVFFPGPFSYTGEDLLELHAHGGPAVLKSLLGAIYSAGARPARPGEFTERAFLNGKIDLIQAEAVASLIDASSHHAASAAARACTGEFSHRVCSINESIVRLRVFLEAHIDFGDEVAVDLSPVQQRFETLTESLSQLLAVANQGAKLNDGLDIAIVGRPNSGKSTLLNRLCGEDRAIVTPIPGTTRDVLSVDVDLNGLGLRIHDTAGLRETADIVEQEGVKRALSQLERAEIVIHVVSVEDTEVPAPPEILKAEQAQKNVLTVINKIDLRQELPALVRNNGSLQVRISALKDQGLSLVKEALHEIAGAQHITDAPFIARARHVDALQRCLSASLAGAAESSQGSIELACEQLRIASSCLEEMIGVYTNEDLLGDIFSTFCIGK